MEKRMSGAPTGSAHAEHLVVRAQFLHHNRLMRTISIAKSPGEHLVAIGQAEIIRSNFRAASPAASARTSSIRGHKERSVRVSPSIRGKFFNDFSRARACACALGEARSGSAWRRTMSYRLVFWSAVGWVALCLAPYVYALNDLITWR